MNPMRAFLEWLFPERAGGVLYVSTRVRSANGGGPWTDHPVADVNEAEALLAKYCDERDVYIATSEFKSGEGRVKGAVIARSVISADIDTKSMPGANEADRRNAAWRLATSVGPAAVIVDTGGGFHVHLRLSVDDRLQARGEGGPLYLELLGRSLRLLLVARAKELFGVDVTIDHVHDLPRVVRAPGTFNRKIPVAPRPVLLAHPSEVEAVTAVPVFDTSVLGAFWDAALRERPTGAEVPSASRAPRIAVMPAALAGVWPLAEGDQSGNDWAVARALAEAGESRETAAAAIRERRSLLATQRERRKGERADYVQRTVERAFRDEERGEFVEAGEGPAEAMELPFQTLDEISTSAAPAVDYIVDGLIAVGAVHLLTGKPKESGKTTLVCALVGAVEAGISFLGRSTQATTAVVVSEEAELTVTPRAMRFGVKRARWLFGRYRGTPWADVLERACEVAAECGAKLLVIDTLAAWASFGDDAENSSTAMLRVTTVLRAAASRGLAVVVTHHARKGESSMADAPRGSSALAADADVLMQLAPAPRARDLRVLAVHGRLLPEPVEIVYGLGPGGLVLANPDAAQDGTIERVLVPLRGVPAGLTATAWRKAAGMNAVAFHEARKRAIGEGLVIEVPCTNKREHRFGLPTGAGGSRDAVPPLMGENSIPSSPLPLVEEAISSAGSASNVSPRVAAQMSGTVPESSFPDAVPQAGCGSASSTGP